METIYYTLELKKAASRSMASGGSVPQVQPCHRLAKPAAPPAAGGGVVLDLEAYRRRINGEDPSVQPPEPAEPAESAPSPRDSSVSRAGLLLDLIATAAVVVMAVAAIALLMPLL